MQNNLVSTEAIIRRKRCASAVAHVRGAVIDLESALGDMTSALNGLTHPILDDMRAALLEGRKVLAKAELVQQRMP